MAHADSPPARAAPAPAVDRQRQHSPAMADTPSSALRNTDGHGRTQAALSLPAGLWSPSATSSTTDVDTHAASSASTAAAQRFPGLRQLYSGAASWRASLRGKPKSTTTETSVSSRPVIVRTYSGGTTSSRAGPRASEQRRVDASAPAASSSSQMPHRPSTLPPTADFSFDGILHAVEPEIAGAIDAIAAICARSKLSLADEYAAHRPPHEILDPAIPIPPSQRQRWWSVVRDTALSAVPEASSSSERLVGSRTASRASVSSAGRSARGRKNSAYGSLKSIVSGDSNARKGLAALFGSSDGHDDGAEYHEPPSPTVFHHTGHWLVSDSTHPSITLSSDPAARAASPRVSLATSEDPMGSTAASTLNGDAAAHGPARQRSNSRSTWLPWPGQEPRPPDNGRASAPDPPTSGTAAEQRLKELLRTTSSPVEGRKPTGADA